MVYNRLKSVLMHPCTFCLTKSSGLRMPKDWEALIECTICRYDRNVGKHSAEVQYSVRPVVSDDETDIKGTQKLDIK